MRILVESCDRVIDLVDTLLEVSRVEQGEAEQDPRGPDPDLRELAAASLEPVRTAAERKGVALDLEFTGESLELEGDRGLLRQVVRKLVDNAVKYSPPGGARGRARVRARRRAGAGGRRTAGSASRRSTCRASSRSSTWWTGA
jgi:signal transduction histidine kinase